MHALLYRRVSTGGQDNSLAAQESGNLAYCQANQWPVAQVFEDPDVSGGLPLAERRGGAVLLTALRTAGADTVLVTAKQDRLGRDNLDIIANVRFIWDLGITPHFTQEGGAFPRTAQNELLLGIKAATSNYELNLIRDRTRTILNHKRAQGHLVGSVPFGWQVQYTFADGATHTADRALFFGGKRGKSGSGGQQPPDAIAASLLAAHGPVLSKLLTEHVTEQWWLRRLVRERFPNWPDQSVKRLSLRGCAALLNGAGIKPKAGAAEWKSGNVANLFDSSYTHRLLAQSAGGGEDGVLKMEDGLPHP